MFTLNRERYLFSMNCFEDCNWSVTKQFDLTTLSRDLLISDEKLLNSLNKYDKFVGGFNARHYSFESLVQ